MTRRFTKYPKKSISASSGSTNKIILSKSELTQQFTDVFNQAEGGVSDEFNPAEELFLRIDIAQDGDGVMVDIEAETYFDQNNILDYDEYRDIMIYDCGLDPSEIQTRSEYYQDKYNAPTLETKMNEVLKQYNPDWYFELYDACHIQAYLDNCILEA